MTPSKRLLPLQPVPGFLWTTLALQYLLALCGLGDERPAVVRRLQAWELDVLVVTAAYCLSRRSRPSKGAEIEGGVPAQKPVVAWEAMQPAQLPDFRLLEVAATAQSAFKTVLAAAQLVGLTREDIPVRAVWPPAVLRMLLLRKACKTTGGDRLTLPRSSVAAAGAPAAVRRRDVRHAVPHRRGGRRGAVRGEGRGVDERCGGRGGEARVGSGASRRRRGARAAAPALGCGGAGGSPEGGLRRRGALGCAGGWSFAP